MSKLQYSACKSTFRTVNNGIVMKKTLQSVTKQLWRHKTWKVRLLLYLRSWSINALALNLNVRHHFSRTHCFSHPSTCFKCIFVLFRNTLNTETGANYYIYETKQYSILLYSESVICYRALQMAIRMLDLMFVSQLYSTFVWTGLHVFIFIHRVQLKKTNSLFLAL